MTKPIGPKEAWDVEKIEPEHPIPDSVIFAFNHKLKHTLINDEGWKILWQDKMVALIMFFDETLRRKEIFDKGYLDVEELFRSYGWEVDFIKGFSFSDTKSHYRFRPAKAVGDLV